MAMIHGVVHGSCVQGLGIVAGSSFGCNALLSTCGRESCGMADCSCQSQYQNLVDGYLQRYASSGYIDPLTSLSGKPAFLFSGSQDSIVYSCVMESVQRQLAGLGLNIKAEYTVPAAHGWVVDGKDFPYPSSYPRCGKHGPDYVEDCQYDLSKIMFEHLLAPQTLQPQAAVAKKANLVRINQASYVPQGYSPGAVGLARVAYAYVPDACQPPHVDSCRLHVHYHGCGGGGAGDTGRGKPESLFYIETPYIAESNNIVVLYPRAVAADPYGRGPNANGCWDWEGYYPGANPYFDTYDGVQVQTVLAMVNDIANAVATGETMIPNNVPARVTIAAKS
eukprot:g3586.t1